MKACSQRNTGETHHDVSRPSRCRSSHERCGAAAALATRELPPVIKPPQVQPSVATPVSLSVAVFFAVTHFQALSRAHQHAALSPAFFPAPLTSSHHLIRGLFCLLSSCLRPHFPSFCFPPAESFLPSSLWGFFLSDRA